jgi:hypothetical protein
MEKLRAQENQNSFSDIRRFVSVLYFVVWYAFFIAAHGLSGKHSINIERASFILLLFALFCRHVISKPKSSVFLLSLYNRKVTNTWVLLTVWIFYCYDNILPLDYVVAAMFSLNCFQEYIGDPDTFI